MPVMAAFVASVTCTEPADSVHATQVSTVPKQRSAARSIVELIEQPLDLGRRLVGPDAHALRPQREARADRAQVLPAEPRTDRDTGRAIPHDRRAALVGDADPVDRSVGGERGAREIETRLSEQHRVELHEPVGRGVGQQLAVVAARERAVGPHDRGADAARPDVDDEHAV